MRKLNHVAMESCSESTAFDPKNLNSGQLDTLIALVETRYKPPMQIDIHIHFVGFRPQQLVTPRSA